MIPYKGPLDAKKMRTIAKRAYWIWQQQKERKGVEYTAREFIAWYLKEFKKRKWTCAHVARFDHSRPYSFENIVMQEAFENVAERNERHGNPGRTHRKVRAVGVGINILFQTKQDAAAYYNVSQKTVYNHCQKRSKSPGKYGPKIPSVRFQWA